MPSSDPTEPSRSVDALASAMMGMAVFAGLDWPQVMGIRHLMEEAAFAPGDRIVRTGMAVTEVHVIVEGTADVEIDGIRRYGLGRGDVIGEVAALLGAPSVADVVAVTSVATLALDAGRLEEVLTLYPTVAVGLLRDVARRLRAAR